jgi:signal transduction histidine kinase
LVYRDFIINTYYIEGSFTAPFGMAFFALFYTVLISMDFTDTKRRESELIKQNVEQDNFMRIKSLLFRNVAHEMKAPLTIISSEIQNVADIINFGMDEVEMRESLANAQNEVMKMARNVDTVMEETSSTELLEDQKSMNIKVLIEDVVKTFQNPFKQKNNELIVLIPDSLPMVYGDYNSLVLVVSNILANANRFTTEGRVTIHAISTEDKVTVTISDNGRGIKQHMIPHVFKRGVSSDSSGLGLSICRTIIEAHSGKIWIESEQNIGTLVFFSLPAM